MANTLDKKLKTAPCQGACPAGIDVPSYIRYIRAGKFQEALGVVRESMPFPAVCGYACVHPCEAQCARRQYDEAIAIRMLKRAAAEFGRENPEYIPPVSVTTGRKVAVVGAGPAGLTAAYYLAGKGHQVIVFEKRAQPGGLMRYGIPEYRLPNEIIDREVAVIRKRGVEIKTNSPVDSAAVLLADGFAAVCVATGAWDSAKIQLPAIEIVENLVVADVGPTVQVKDGLAFLEAANSNSLTSVGERVLVIGGGNTAIDAARTAVRLGGKDVTIVYRRSRREMPASAEEVVDARQEGVKFEFLAVPVKLGRRELTCARMALGEADSSGRPRTQIVQGSEFSIACDQVILAVGQAADAASLGLPANSNGTAQIAFNSLAVKIPGIFAAGDIVKGPSTTIEAIAQGRLVAVEIDRMLGGDGIIAEKWVPAENEDSSDFASLGQIRLHPVHIPLSERLSTFRLAERGYDRETAMTEANRCLGCDIHSYEVRIEAAYCKECGYCQDVCGQRVYEQSESFNGQGYRPMVAASTDKCVGCLKCLMICPDFAISVW